MAVFDSSLTDPYISNLLSADTKFRRPLPSITRMSSSSVTNLIQFLESVPTPVTILLIRLAPMISWLRRAAEVLAWKSHWTDPWLVISCWWIICLTADVFLRYLLPLVFLLPPLLRYLPSRSAANPPIPPATEELLSHSLADIAILQSLIPTLPALPDLPFRVAIRLSAVFYVLYLLLPYVIPIPIFFGFAGTLLLTYRAPWARTMRTVLWGSAYVRRCFQWAWSLLMGVPSPTLASYTVRTTDSDQVSHAPPSPPIRFLFTILECQRWWMGLDWTAALLPAERPSWCSVSLQPVSPPSAFSLPPPASIHLPAPDGRRVKRTAKWRWEETEWGVLVNKEGSDPKRVEKKPPGLEEEEAGARIASKAASMLRERKTSTSSRPEMSPTKDDRESNPPNDVGSPEQHGEEVATDPDGWVYGDNKWEAAGPRGGIGKYTRFRRWTRIAVLEETVEIGRPDEEIYDAEGKDAPSIELLQDKGPDNESESHSTGEHGEGRQNLRQRLNNTLQASPN